jgi:hypothetical protein
VTDPLSGRHPSSQHRRQIRAEGGKGVDHRRQIAAGETLLDGQREGRRPLQSGLAFRQTALAALYWRINANRKEPGGMMRQRPSMGFLGKFGRSSDLRQLDAALKSVDLHPNLVPEPVKITVVNLLKDHAPDADPAAQSYREAAEIVGYCMIGAEPFAGANDEDLARRVEDRIEAALDAGDSLDAQLILLTLHAKVIQPSVVERFRLESE